MQTVLTIAGFDPSNGAGVTADLAVMASLGLFGTSCVTALTVQSTVGVKSMQVVEAGLVRETLQWLTRDLPPAGVKIGMLGNAEIVAVVAEFLAGLGDKVPVVLDPVIRSSSGRELLDETGVVMLRERLLPLVDWVTPNVAELAVLMGEELDLEAAALALCGRSTRLNVVATGGDQDRPDDLVAMRDGRLEWLRGERIESRATHGTGCAFSTALLCGLVEGMDGLKAARRAKAFVREAILRAEVRGQGKGPMELYWPLRR